MNLDEMKAELAKRKAASALLEPVTYKCDFCGVGLPHLSRPPYFGETPGAVLPAICASPECHQKNREIGEMLERRGHKGVARWNQG